MIKTNSTQSPVNMNEAKAEEDSKKEENLYSEDYYDHMVKKMFEDPLVNKK